MENVYKIPFTTESVGTEVKTFGMTWEVTNVPSLSLTQTPPCPALPDQTPHNPPGSLCVYATPNTFPTVMDIRRKIRAGVAVTPYGRFNSLPVFRSIAFFFAGMSLHHSSFLHSFECLLPELTLLGFSCGEIAGWKTRVLSSVYSRLPHLLPPSPS